MVLEIAQIDVKPGLEAEFEAAVEKATPIFRQAKGCRSMDLQRSIERPNRYRVMLEWETLEDSTVSFQKSIGLQEWRKLVGHCFENPPMVEHMREVLKGF
jgi:heme-degrading monooxygenase HmoA